jgi:hypothetical protein
LDDDLEILESNIEETNKHDLKRFWIDNPSEQRHGFIGSNYRRLDIKFLSIIKNSETPNQYFIFGKSRVSNNICEFQGTIEIEESFYIKSLRYFKGNSGVIAGHFVFFETPDCNHSGVFKGQFVTYWTKNEKGEFEYMDLPAIEGNNQFAGYWTNYKNTNKIIANLGDRRLPNSGDLDIGTSEFGINRKYQENGWDSFIKAHGGGYDNETMEEARRIELLEWWKE